jgi:hypothetical protein
VKATVPKMGRPALGERARLPAFTIRLSEAERVAVYAAAEREGKPVTQWAREALLIAVRDPVRVDSDKAVDMRG